MSCDCLLGLDELFDYKNQLMDDLLTEKEIVRLLSDDCATCVAPEDLMYTQVFPCEYVPEVTEHGQTFICCEVDIKEVSSKLILNPVIYVWVFTHSSKVRMPEGGLRIDRITSEIVKKINGSRMYGLGELELYSVKRFSPIANYQGRVLQFHAKDFNRLRSHAKPIPNSRKHV